MRSAAVFDLDGTLIRGTSAERLLLPHLLRRGLVGPAQISAALRRALALPWIGATAALEANKRWLAGVLAEPVLETAGDFVESVVLPRLHADVLARLKAHQARRERVWLLTGAPDFVAREVALRLEMDGMVATSLEVRDARFTGEVAGRHVFAQAKSEALLELASEAGFDLAASTGFADHATDEHFLGHFGRAVAVAPDRRLRRIARERGWEMISPS